MFGFGRGAIPPDETIEWAFDAARHWLESFGGYEANRAAARVLQPSEEDFPVDLSLRGHELARDYFDFAVEHALLSPDMDLRLEIDEAPDIGEALRGMPHHATSMTPAAAVGRRLKRSEGLPIPYDPRMLEDPEAFVATIARGMSHYLLYRATSEAPFDEDDAEGREYAVDLGAVFLGFGLFLANSAFRFSQVTEGTLIGWGAARRGALSELDVSFVLALYVTLFELPEAQALPHLRPNPRGFFRDARRHLRERRASELKRLRSIPGSGDGPYR